ncbi:MAG: hypothetical protein IT384_10710 [Deltaproteobacteria bacterium]|nr:hypothetical protein [Deltaproteobacteria bacterium]
MKVKPTPDPRIRQAAESIAESLAKTEAETVKKVLSKTPGHSELPANMPGLAKVLSGGAFQTDVDARFLLKPTEADLTNLVRNGASAQQLAHPVFEIGERLGAFWDALVVVHPALESFRNELARPDPQAKPNHSPRALKALADAVEDLLVAANTAPLGAELLGNGFASVARTKPLLDMAGPAVKDKLGPLSDEMLGVLVDWLGREFAKRAVAPLQQEQVIQRAQARLPK